MNATGTSSEVPDGPSIFQPTLMALNEMKFTGKVSSRSSKTPGQGPPGETEIMKLNPKRRTRILDATKWSDLQAGSLNLEVNQVVVKNLEGFVPDLEEDGADIIYPEKYANIPKLRKGYWYYKAVASSSHEIEEVLVRRAINPLSCRLELFAQVNLRGKFGLSDDAPLDVEIRSNPKKELADIQVQYRHARINPK